jgi:hypothetical protein
MLRFAARHADIVGVNPRLPSSDERAASHLDGVAERIDEKFEWIRDAAGKRYDNLVFHGWVKQCLITANPRPAARDIAHAIGVPSEDVLDSPFFLLGSVGEIVERLHERRDRWGYSYYTIPQSAARSFSPVLERLGL